MEVVALIYSGITWLAHPHTSDPDIKWIAINKNVNKIIYDKKLAIPNFHILIVPSKVYMWFEEQQHLHISLKIIFRPNFKVCVFELQHFYPFGLHSFNLNKHLLYSCINETGKIYVIVINWMCVKYTITRFISIINQNCFNLIHFKWILLAPKQYSYALIINMIIQIKSNRCKQLITVPHFLPGLFKTV